MRLTLTVFKVFLSFPRRFLKSKIFFHESAPKNVSVAQNLLSKSCKRRCPFIHIAIMCTSFVEITGVIEIVYVVLTVIVLQRR